MTDSPNHSEPTRVPGLYGARESHEPRLLLSKFRVGTNPVPDTWDVTSGITAWGMDGNDQYGDCGAAATDHFNVAKAADVRLIDQLGRPKFDGVVGTYAAYGEAMGYPVNPQTGIPDQGVDNASWLGFLYQQGLIDGYGEVPLSEIHTYGYEFGGVLIAVVLDDDSQQEFADGQPWGGPGDLLDPSLGHDILLVKSHPSGGTFVTWGALQDATPEFFAQNVTDAWVILDADDAKRTGHDWTALVAALYDIHGDVNPTDPAPVDPAPVDAAPVGIAQAIVRGLRDIADEIEKLL